MIRDIMTNGFSLSTVVSLMARVFVVFCVMPIHEYAHALVATKLGDETARLSGRLTLNPLAHLDLLGSIMIFLVGFGYAKPVPVNPRNFKDPKVGMGITAAAGPISNIIMAIAFMLLRNGAAAAYVSTGSTVASVSSMFFFYAAYVNVTLGVFNLVPVPPLDGSRILGLFLPSKYYFKLMQYERYIMIAVLVLMFTGLLSAPISLISGGIMNGIDFITSLPFKFILK